MRERHLSLHLETLFSSSFSDALSPGRRRFLLGSKRESLWEIQRKPNPLISKTENSLLERCKPSRKLHLLPPSSDVLGFVSFLPKASYFYEDRFDYFIVRFILLIYIHWQLRKQNQWIDEKKKNLFVFLNFGCNDAWWQNDIITIHFSLSEANKSAMCEAASHPKGSCQ